MLDVMGTLEFVLPGENARTIDHSTDLVFLYPGPSVKGGSNGGFTCAIGIFENGSGERISFSVGGNPVGQSRWDDVEWIAQKYGGLGG
mgnify:CR=1 FL=1